MLAERSTRVRDGGARLLEMQRSRLLAAAVGALAEFGYEGMSVARITERARISRRTFYELFENREECLLATLENAVERISSELDAAGLDGMPWRERVRGGLWTILSFFDREPLLARVCVVESQRAGQPIAEFRQRTLDRLASLLDEHNPAGTQTVAPGLIGQGVVGGVCSILYAHLLKPESGPLSDLFGELMAMIALPYLGTRVARAETQRPVPDVGVTGDRVNEAGAVWSPSLPAIPMRLTYRTALVLEDIREHPGSSNRETAERVEIHDQGQISKLLNRLQRVGLLSNNADGAPIRGEANQWRLTLTGRQLVDALAGQEQPVSAGRASTKPASAAVSAGTLDSREGR